MWSGSKLATSSSSSATVGERAARTTVGLTRSHRRHERHERRDPPAFAIARNMALSVWTILTSEYTHHKKWFGASHLKKRHPPTHLPPYEYEFFQ